MVVGSGRRCQPAICSRDRGHPPALAAGLTGSDVMQNRVVCAGRLPFPSGAPKASQPVHATGHSVSRAQPRISADTNFKRLRNFRAK